MQRKAEKSRREFTVRRLTADYVEEISERKRTCAEDQRIFNVYVLPVIGDLSVAEVDRKAVSKVLKYLNGKAAMKRNVIARHLAELAEMTRVTDSRLQPALFMNILLRLTIYAKTQGVHLSGARRTVQYACAPYSPRHPVFLCISSPSRRTFMNSPG